MQLTIIVTLERTEDRNRSFLAKAHSMFRVGHDLHLAASVVATRQSITLNDLTRRALREYLEHQ